MNSLGTSSEDIKETMAEEISQKINEEIADARGALVQVGAVVAAHGLKGEVRVYH